MTTTAVKTVTAVSLLVTACIALVLLGMKLRFAQDWIPFHVAPTLARAGNWEGLYIDKHASSLFDWPEPYRIAAESLVQTDGRPVFRTDKLTAFVSPPPAAFLLAPLDPHDWNTSLTLWRVLILFPLIGTITAFALVHGAAGPDALLRWALLCTVMLPLFMYVIAGGQPTAWLILAAMISMARPSRALDAVGGLAIAVGVLTKATPLLIIVGLWVAGRKRLALIAAGITVAAIAASWPFTGIDAWRHFAEGARHLGQSVITDWNNASIDALILRLTTRTVDSTFRTPGIVITSIAWAVRLLIVGTASRIAVGRFYPPGRRVAAVWIAWLAIGPLLWLHYLLVLAPILGYTLARQGNVALFAGAALTIAFTARLADLNLLIVGTAGCLSWLGTSLWLLSPKPWLPPDEVILPEPDSPAGS